MPTIPAATSPDRALRLLPDGCVLVAGPCCGTPTTLLRALGARATAARGWDLWSGLLQGPLDFVDAVAQHRLSYRTWQVSRGTRDLVAQGAADFMPLRASRVPSVLAQRGVEVAFVRVSPPDRWGYCSLGASVSYPMPLIRLARIVIAEVDEEMPRTWGRSMVHASAFAALVESEDPTPEYPSAPVTDVSRRIAEHVLGLLPERPVLQLGLGSVPESITAGLANADLGPLRFIGMGNDGMVPLFAAGGMARPADGGWPPLAAVELMGTRALLDFADDNPEVGVYPVGEAGDPARLAKIDRLVSVNSAVQVDLAGNSNSEWIAGTQIGGVGGGIDFLEGAGGSAGGIRIVALPSTAGDHSRIVARPAHRFRSPGTASTTS